MLVPKLKAPKGYIRLNETSYDKLVNYHFDNGFCILTAFRSEFTMAENRARNKKLAADLKANDLGFIRVTGGYREVIDKDNVNWDDAEVIPDNDEKRLLTIMEELSADGALTFKESGGMVTSINGKDNPADWSACWMLYTSDEEFSNTAWGSYLLEDMTLGSAIVGAESLPIKAGEYYVWSYQTF